ncbi:hypothetical protein HYW40_01450 [Candidatus Curtissbacteria bacterium]|nr:hypothetical protein [Candidatus Curtissbacteria bacterium]
MRKILALCLIIFVTSLFFLTKNTNADELSDLQKEIDDLERQLDLSKAATTPLESEVKSLEAQLASITARIGQIQQDLAQSEEDLAYQKKILARTVRNFYIGSFVDIPLLTLFSSGDATEALKTIVLQQESSREDKDIISEISVKIAKRADDKKRLAAAQAQVSRQSQFFKGEIAKAKSYQSELEGKIAALSARQQEILAARSGSVITSVGEVPIGSDYNASIAFKSQAPANSLAVFAFGGYTHRNGMSQYGAKEQAKTKNYKEIIQWYYGSGVKKDEGMPNTISVQGYGDMNFQTYLYGIAEMPSDWPQEALKAQAVAARTYGNRAGKPICTTEACQVFSKSKSDNPPASWKQAVDDTNKEVIDGDVSAQYSSTAGGYLNTSGWDTTDRSNSGDWTTRAWESKAGSPWFYKAWYRLGYTNDGPSCSRSHPWLSQEEFADIVNAAIVLNGVDNDDRILPTTINQCPIAGNSGNPYSISELRDKANEHGGAVTSVSAVSVSNNSNGQTSNVHLETNRGGIDTSGAKFKQAFNLRAPAYISIPQSGFAFFNIEKN